jgi:hypothetical protein
MSSVSVLSLFGVAALSCKRGRDTSMDKEKRRTELPEKFADAPVGGPRNVASELADGPRSADPEELPGEPDLGDYTGKNIRADDSVGWSSSRKRRRSSRG